MRAPFRRNAKSEHGVGTRRRLGAERRARASLGTRFDATLEAFVARFPPPDVASGAPAAAALKRHVAGVPGVHVALEEAWTCFLANANPALRGARPLVDGPNPEPQSRIPRREGSRPERILQVGSFFNRSRAGSDPGVASEQK